MESRSTSDKVTRQSKRQAGASLPRRWARSPTTRAPTISSRVRASISSSSSNDARPRHRPRAGTGTIGMAKQPPARPAIDAIDQADIALPHRQALLLAATSSSATAAAAVLHTIYLQRAGAGRRR